MCFSLTFRQDHGFVFSFNKRLKVKFLKLTSVIQELKDKDHTKYSRRSLARNNLIWSSQDEEEDHIKEKTLDCKDVYIFVKYRFDLIAQAYAHTRVWY